MNLSKYILYKYSKLMQVIYIVMKIFVIKSYQLNAYCMYTVINEIYCLLCNKTKDVLILFTSYYELVY